mmetsp:Transcript_13794/g.57650  ORF Transcript_13794/g.57650 Transcript_13794/m.57650 type:complete len:212 (-) Transcript_13794:20-655(-)
MSTSSPRVAATPQSARRRCFRPTRPSARAAGWQWTGSTESSARRTTQCWCARTRASGARPLTRSSRTSRPSVGTAKALSTAETPSPPQTLRSSRGRRAFTSWSTTATSSSPTKATSRATTSGCAPRSRCPRSLAQCLIARAISSTSVATPTRRRGPRWPMPCAPAVRRTTCSATTEARCGGARRSSRARLGTCAGSSPGARPRITLLNNLE